MGGELLTNGPHLLFALCTVTTIPAFFPSFHSMECPDVIMSVGNSHVEK